MAEQIVQLNTNTTSGAKIRTQELTEGANTVEQQVITNAGSNGDMAEVTKTNALKVQPEFAYYWRGDTSTASSTTPEAGFTLTAAGTASSISYPTGASAGTVLLNAGTATSGKAYGIGTQSLPSSEPALSYFSIYLKLESTTILTNTNRYWGFGNNTTPTFALPTTDGFGFEVDNTGALNAVTWAGSVRTLVAALTIPVDGAYHRYTVAGNADSVFWYIDNMLTPVATQTPPATTLNGTFNKSFYPKAHVTNSTTTAPTSAPTLQIADIGIGSPGLQKTILWSQNSQISNDSNSRLSVIAAQGVDSSNISVINTWRVQAERHDVKLASMNQMFSATTGVVNIGTSSTATVAYMLPSTGSYGAYIRRIVVTSDSNVTVHRYLAPVANVSGGTLTVSSRRGSVGTANSKLYSASSITLPTNATTAPTFGVSAITVSGFTSLSQSEILVAGTQNVQLENGGLYLIYSGTSCLVWQVTNPSGSVAANVTIDVVWAEGSAQ